MFVCTRHEALEAVEKLGPQLCDYSNSGGSWAAFCDCKYGGPSDAPASEKTGCPELRSLRLVLNNLTDDEWAAAVARTEATWRPIMDAEDEDGGA